MTDSFFLFLFVFHRGMITFTIELVMNSQLKTVKLFGLANIFMGTQVHVTWGWTKPSSSSETNSAFYKPDFGYSHNPPVHTNLVNIFCLAGKAAAGYLGKGPSSDPVWSRKQQTCPDKCFQADYKLEKLFISSKKEVSAVQSLTPMQTPTTHTSSCTLQALLTRS